MLGCSKQKSFEFPVEGVEISKVLSSFSVGFSMLEKNNRLYIAYYDSIHQMTLAMFDLSSGKIEYEVLPSKIGWDSHNYITMAFDKSNNLHLSGNMHVSPLVYFRTETPLDIHSIKKVESMTGVEESHTTYPSFMSSPDGSLIFHYRTGGSGNGSEIYNIYDLENKTWKRLFDEHLTDGEGKRNAYMQGPMLGKDNFYHLIWVWRDRPDCSTNHTLSYARSKDLINWESICGKKTELPITFDKTEFYVDDTPVKGGLFNPGIKLGFDSKNNPVIGYHKYDKDGFNQLYVARYENGNWNKVKLTDWKYRWEFGGTGSINNELEISSPMSISNNEMVLGYEHIKEGKGEIIFDEKTFVVKGKREKPQTISPKFLQVRSSFLGMSSRIIIKGDYLLRWETLSANRDRKPDGKLPEASTLTLYKWK